MSVEDFYRGKKVVVTGGCGFVGGTLSEKLVAAGAEVTILDNGSKGTRKPEGAAIFPVDVNHLSNCEFWFEDAFAVFNLAASVAGVLHNMSHHLEMYSENVGLLLTPLMAAERAGVKHFLQTSSVCVYDPQLNHPSFEETGLLGTPHFANAGYAEAKRDGERFVGWSNLDHAVIVRPSNVFGPHDYFDDKAHVIPALIKKALEDDVINVYGPSQVEREFIYSHDVAEGMMHALAYGMNKTAYNIGCHGKNRTSIANLVDMIQYGTGTEDKRVVFHTERGGGDPIRFSSCARMNDLGWEFRMPLHIGLINTIEWYKNEQARIQDSINDV
jgi:GDP-L-fucose synthase